MVKKSLKYREKIAYQRINLYTNHDYNIINLNKHPKG